MTDESLPLVISAPEPRTLDLIFTPAAEAALRRTYRIVEADPEDIAGLGDAVLGQARYILGQPPLSRRNAGAHAEPARDPQCREQSPQQHAL